MNVVSARLLVVVMVAYCFMFLASIASEILYRGRPVPEVFSREVLMNLALRSLIYLGILSVATYLYYWFGVALQPP